MKTSRPLASRRARPPGQAGPGTLGRPAETAVAGASLVDPSITEPAPEDGGLRAVPLLPGPRTWGRRLRFGLVNALTLAGLALGFTALGLALDGRSSTAAIVMILVALGDGADGMLARAWGVATPFGGQLDSLCDMATFGVICPLVVVQAHGGLVALREGVVLGALAMAVAAAIRLAKFVISPRSHNLFSGVPTTASALLLCGWLLFFPGAGAMSSTILMLTLAALMVSPLPYPKLAAVLHAPGWLIGVGLAMALLAFIAPGLIAPALGIGYLGFGPVVWMDRRYR